MMSSILPTYLFKFPASTWGRNACSHISEATPLVSSPRPLPLSVPRRGGRDESSVQAPAAGTRGDRLRGRFSQATGQYTVESLFGTSVRNGTVLVADPLAPQPRISARALNPAEPGGSRLRSASKQQTRNAAARMQAAHAVLGASSHHASPHDVCDTGRPAPLPDGWSGLDRTTILFPGAAPGAIGALQSVLHSTLNRFELSGTADATLMLDVLAQAARGDPRFAREIVERLAAGIDFRDSGHLANGSDQSVERGMWRTAQLLSRTDDGFRLLQALQPDGAVLGRAARIILQVGDHCLPHTDDDPVPCAFDTLIEIDSQRRLDLPAAVRRAAYRMLDPGATLSTEERGLVFAWEQGFRDDGPGTVLHAVKHRLAKFTHASIPRVEASRWRSLVSRICGYKKSPLTAMRMGMQGAHRGTLAAERAETRSAGPDSLQAAESPGYDLQLSRPNRNEAAQLLDRLVSSMQSSSRVRFGDGGRRGLSLQGLTIGLSNFLHTAGIPLGLRLNLSRHRGKRSELEIARTTGGGEINFGTRTQRQSTIGAGAIVGYDFNAGAARLRSGFGIDLARTRQARRSSGVVLRVARRRLADGTGFDDQRMKTGMRNVVRFLFDESSCKGNASADAVFDRFASRFFDDPDISLGALKSDGASLEHHAAACASLTASIAATGLRIGPSAALTAGRTSMWQRHAADTEGRLQATSFRRGAQTELAFTAGLNGKIGGNTSDVGLLNASLAQVTIPLYRHGQYGTVRLFRERGLLQSDACTLDLEFTSVEEYARAIGEDIRSLTVSEGGAGTGKKNGKSGCKKEEAGAEPIGPYPETIDVHLADARHFARNNQTFVIRKRLSAAVARVIDRNADTAETIRGCEHLPATQRRGLCRQLDAESAGLLARADSWVAPELKVMERSGRMRRVGLQSAFRLASESSAEGERCLANLVLDTKA